MPGLGTAARWITAYYACSIAAAAGAELRVPDSWPTLAAAVRAARPGDTIHIHGGVHTGNLMLDKPVSLIGECDPVIRGSGRGPVITLLSEGCRLNGLMIENSGRGMAESDAGIRLRSSGNVVESCRISECLFGIYLDRSSHNLLRLNSVQGMIGMEIGERGSGIHLYDSHHNRVEGNTVLDARDGIYFDHANFNTVTACSFRGARYGLHYMSSDDNVFVDNRFSECMAGATIMFSRRLRFESNWFVNNRGYSSVGALLKDCYNSTAVNNLFADNSTGMILDNSMENRFERNLIYRNDLALHLFSGSIGNTFARNDFRENLSPIRLLGKGSGTRWAADGRGNYWSEYEGYDLDNDGVGDVPYTIQNVFELLEGDFPGLRFFLVSPAAAALRAGETAFPMFEFSREVDPAPLMSPVTAGIASRWRGEVRRPFAATAAVAFCGVVLCLAMIAGSRMSRMRVRV